MVFARFAFNPVRGVVNGPSKMARKAASPPLPLPLRTGWSQPGGGQEKESGRMTASRWYAPNRMDQHVRFFKPMTL